MALILPLPPPHIFDLPIGHYRISYDVSFHDTEDDLPNGWHPQGGTYRRIIRRLREAGFTRHQSGDYSRINSHPIRVWMDMQTLFCISPPSKFQSMLLNLKAYRIQTLEVDVTDYLRLGGTFSTTVTGPIPAGLVARVPPGVLHPPPVVPGPDFVRPVDTRPSAMADDRNNYRM
ncbi:uncharacterized protein EI90DRAFT_3017118 [Cantharellus anzutake]|uniref:uncharacterized protein n=1 Tax=Cantharellus anzutake TaxID=1750568 RepID=UPI001906A22E|nr:uncharacterized protein EI90DRAFT_3017118 [Cantharellus anzutake]KAF8329822.1 hypothetical protein EI90DRAFT_3017118 [Cantharellus anzutake]